MKIAFVTNSPNAACSEFYINGLKDVEADISFLRPLIVPENVHAWKSFDVVLVMTYDHEHCKSLRNVIKKEALLGLIDPRGSKVLESTEYCDFLIVDSIEMEDFWRQSKKKIFRYAEYPDIGYWTKNHVNREKVTIGYHGNTLHLEEMRNTVSLALKKLSSRYEIELLVMYNGNPPTGKETWFVDSVKTIFIPWSYKNYTKYLASADIGIVPNNLIVERGDVKLKNKNEDNYVLSFKMPSNPGRIITFGQLGIPVVSDFFPSAFNILCDGKNGFVAKSAEGWEYCLEQLIVSPDLRNEMSENLRKEIIEKYEFSAQNKRLLNFLKDFSI